MKQLFIFIKLNVSLIPKRSWWSMCMALLCVIMGYVLYVYQPNVETNQVNFYEQKLYLLLNTIGLNFILSSIFLLSLISVFKRLNIIDMIARIVIGVITGIIIGFIIWMILIYIKLELDLLSSFTLAINVGLLLGQITAFIMIFKDVVVEIVKNK